jgi:hypothetical protein
MGINTTASGKASTAMGQATTASDYGSLVMGRYNSVGSSVTSGGSATAFDTDNSAFVIGNGTASGSESDALVVYSSGNATLSGDLTVGTGSAAGVFQSNGNNDLTLKTGNSTTGSITITDGANGDIAITPNGSGKVQLDGLAWPTADGSANQVLKTDGSGALSWATQGGTTLVQVTESSKTGWRFSTATAANYGSLVMGKYNSVGSSVTSGGSANAFDTDNSAFVIGNGTASGSESDALVVYSSGNATLGGDLTISGSLDVTGSMNLGVNSTITSSTTFNGTATVIPVNASSGNITVTIDTDQKVAGRILIIKQLGGGDDSVLIATEGSEQIQGGTSSLANTYQIASDYVSVQLFCDGSNWYDLSAN